MEISAPNTFGTHKGVVLTHSLFVALATFLLALLSLSLSSEAHHFTPLWFPTAAPWLLVALLGAGPLTFPLLLTLINLRTRTSAGSAALSGFAQNFTQLMLARIGVGVGEVV